MKNYHIAVVPGDGIGHEIVPAGLKVVKAVAEKQNFQITSEEFQYSSGYYKTSGMFMPEDALEERHCTPHVPNLCVRDNSSISTK